MAELTLLEKASAYIFPDANSVGGNKAAFLQDCLDEAVALVNNWCGTAQNSVPVAVLHRAYIECTSELYHRRSAPQGVTQYASPDGGAAPMRTSRDPMGGARLVLAPFLPGGFA